MNTAGKVAIGLLVVGGIGAAVLLSSPATAHASPKPLPPPPPVPPTPGPPLTPAGQPQDHDPQAGGVVVAPPSSGGSIGVVPPPAGAVPTPTPGGGVSLPLPGGGSVTVPAGTLPNVSQTPGGGTVLTLPGGAVVPLPSGTPSLPGLPAAPTPAAPPGVVNVPPVVVTATGEPTAPGDTIQVVQAMLGQEGNNTSWRGQAVPGLDEWQRARGLVPDGQFGTKSALRMAEEVGAIPIVRGWPRGSTKEGHWLPDYKASLQQIANSKTGRHADLLRESAVREEGQGFGTPPKPILHPLTLEG